MNIILLSGGSGKRLWPLSNDIRSKQFIKIFKNEFGERESMVQRMYRGIKKVDEKASITIATSKTQVSAIRNQIGEDVSVSIEPTRRDTFPAIVLATSYLHDVLKISEDESVVVCPVDPFVEEDYFEMLEDLYEESKNSKANLTLVGIEPTYPSEKYGYIIPKYKNTVSEVKSFKEKPSKEVAEEYIKEGALWNGGIFAYKLKYVLDIGHQLIDFKDYYDLYEKYESLNKISFDYAVVENEKSINVMKYNGDWKDLGTWNTLTESMDENIIGNGIFGDNCEGSFIINELSMPIFCTGLQDVIVAASRDGILVTDKENSKYIKKYVESIDYDVKYAEKSWGTYQVLDVQDESLTSLLTVFPNHQMSYHSHNDRKEVWNIVSGNGTVIIDGIENNVQAGDVIEIPSGVQHTIKANTELKIIEVQLGSNIDVKDKVKYK